MNGKSPAPQPGPAATVLHRPLRASERKRLSGPALRTFFRLATVWKLSTSEQMGLLGFPPKSTFDQWRKTPGSVSLSDDALQRLSLIFGIFEELQTLMPTPDAADNWIRIANDAPLFGGHAPISLMSSGRFEDLFGVRRYLYAVGEGWA